MSSAPFRRGRHAFTLIELLVVIAIIAILIGLLLSAVQQARTAGENAACKNNLKQIGLAMMNHHDVYGSFPSAHVEMADSHGALQYWTGWGIQLLPYLDQTNLYNQYNNTMPNTATANLPVLQHPMAVYTCPVDPRANQLIGAETLAPNAAGQPTPPILYMASSYKVMTGLADTSSSDTFAGYGDSEIGTALRAHPNGKGAFHGDGVSGLAPERAGTVTDGLSNTLFVGERHTRTHFSRGPFWASSFNLYNAGAAYPYSSTLLPDYDLCKSHVTENYCKYAWGSLHPGGGINFLFGDGSVHTIPPTIDMNIFMDLSTIAGGEPVSNVF